MADVTIHDLLTHRDWVRRAARALVRGDADAEDLEQRTWLRALEHPPAEPPRSPRAWLRTVLRFAAIDTARAKGTRRRHEEAAAIGERSDAAPDALVARAETTERLVRALLELDEPYRATLLLRFFDDLPPREIALRQGVPVETVRTRVRRGLGALRLRLGAGPGGESGAWMAALVPLAGTRVETAAFTGGVAMASKTIAGVAVAGAVVGGLVGGVVGRVTAGRSGETADLRVELATLRSRIDGFAAEPPSPSAARAADGDRLAGLEQRLHAIEVSAPFVGAGGASGDPGDGDGSRPPRETPEEREDRERRARESGAALERGQEAIAALQRTTEDLRRRALDRSLADGERIGALQRLRFLPEGINTAVVDGMVAWFRETGEPTTRDALLREFHNTKTEPIRTLFLDALRTDPDEKVRVRAARDIDTWGDDPAVLAALEAALSGDTSEDVRKQAARTMEGIGRPRR